ncbi:MAG: hypothetical protein EBT03_11345 [Betaproteobacteria bacterium]|nr:hypothetical protein [Betaproteobacteria bacterium]
MADGEGCTCAAHSEAECGCDADWTPQEVYDLRAENAAVYGLLADIRAAVGDPTGKLMQDELVAHCRSLRFSDAERQALREAADAYELNNGDADCERIATTLRSLLARLA